MIVRALLFLLVCAVAADAQVVTTQYRLTRNSPTVASYVFPKTAMTCGLPRGPLADVGLRVNDPLNDALDCQLLGTANGVIVSGPGAYTLAAGSADNLWSQESTAFVVVPPLPPSNPRVRPGVTARVTADGVIENRFNWGGLDVAAIRLVDYGNLLIHVGAPSLTIPGYYSAERGDRFSFTFWR